MPVLQQQRRQHQSGFLPPFAKLEPSNKQPVHRQRHHPTAPMPVPWIQLYSPRSLPLTAPHMALAAMSITSLLRHLAPETPASRWDLKMIRLMLPLSLCRRLSPLLSTPASDLQFCSRRCLRAVLYPLPPLLHQGRAVFFDN
mmetsp:Transcript_11311/g.35856  ORF Transcript_11311/g.35856 Transcript_11311/m.35856 type:complete len:142 (+) Transcript_11311:1214-1639(+)